MNFILSIIKFIKFKPIIKFKKFARHNCGMEVSLGSVHLVLWDRALPPKRVHSPQFSVRVCCGQGQTAGLIKMPLNYGGRPQPRRLCV